MTSPFVFLTSLSDFSVTQSFYFAQSLVFVNVTYLSENLVNFVCHVHYITSQLPYFHIKISTIFLKCICKISTVSTENMQSEVTFPRYFPGIFNRSLPKSEMYTKICQRFYSVIPPKPMFVKKVLKILQRYCLGFCSQI